MIILSVQVILRSPSGVARPSSTSTTQRILGSTGFVQSSGKVECDVPDIRTNPVWYCDNRHANFVEQWLEKDCTEDETWLLALEGSLLDDDLSSDGLLGLANASCSGMPEKMRIRFHLRLLT